MARGQAQKADTQLGTTNAVGAQEQQKSNDLQNKLIPGYTSMMDTGYMSPAEEGAATTSEMGAATQPFESAGFKADQRAGATHNASDLTSQQDQLALDEGRTAGTAAAHLQDQKMQNQEAGMYGLNQIQSGDQHAMESMYGLGPGTLNGRAAGPSGDQLAMGWAKTLTGQG
jgi:hypothetical protein